MSVLFTNIRLTKRGFLSVFVTYFSISTWYYIFYGLILGHIVGYLSEANLVFGALFNLIVAFTMPIGIFFVNKVRAKRLLYLWSMATTIGSIILIFTSSLIYRLVIFLSLGAVFGIGQLAFCAYFWSLTSCEDRGRVGGFAGFLSILLLPFIFALVAIISFVELVVLTCILSLGVLIIELLHPDKKLLTRKKEERGLIWEKRSILLYLIPWIIFSFVNGTLQKNISFNITQLFPEFILLSLVQGVAASFGGLIGGIIADFLGRKVALISGLSFYGVSTALVSFAKTYETVYIGFVVSGLCWGVLLSMYLLTVWGDLSTKRNFAVMYAAGLMPYYISVGFGNLYASHFLQIPLTVAGLVSCLLIFISNMPLVLAPELLPLDVREKLGLRLYLRQMKRILKKREKN